MPLTELAECNGYYARIERDRDGIIHGRVIGLEEIINFKAVSKRLVDRQFAKALEAYFERCRLKGVEPEKPRQLGY